MGKCIECYYSATVCGNQLACQGQKYMPIVGANWGCECFKPKTKRGVFITEGDIKQLEKFSELINGIIRKYYE